MGEKRILVVDDELDMRIFVSTVVKTIGFEPIEATNGSEAIEKARSIKTDLVVLDIMMPKIEDGIETYQQFRTDEDLAGIPIIMLSAITKKTFFHTIRMLNPQKGDTLPEPEAYMEKPPDASELIKLIKDILG